MRENSYERGIVSSKKRVHVYLVHKIVGPG